MEYIWGLGCKPHLCPHASHMTLHMAYIWVTYDNAIGVGAGLYMCDVVKKKFTFAISSPDEFLFSLYYILY